MRLHASLTANGFKVVHHIWSHSMSISHWTLASVFDVRWQGSSNMWVMCYHISFWACKNWPRLQRQAWWTARCQYHLEGLFLFGRKQPNMSFSSKPQQTGQTHLHICRPLVFLLNAQNLSRTLSKICFFLSQGQKSLSTSISDQWWILWWRTDANQLCCENS